MDNVSKIEWKKTKKTKKKNWWYNYGHNFNSSRWYQQQIDIDMDTMLSGIYKLNQYLMARSKVFLCENLFHQYKVVWLGAL